MYYKKLKTKSLNKKFKNQNVKEEDLIYYLQLLYSTAAFSTFPYLVNRKNSRQALKYNCGNCISLAMIIKNYLKKEKKITSYLIPATIPKQLYKPGYLNISHVALAIPYSKTGVYIVDPAFYFLEPINAILSELPRQNPPILKSKIYYHQTSLIYSKTYRLSKSLQFNKYQKISKNTVVCECINDDNESWMYFFTEILNPDEAISTFFINIRKEPFITTTELDSNGICQKRLDLRIRDKNSVDISLRDKHIYSGLISEIPDATKNLLEDLLGEHFKNSVYENLIVPVSGPYYFN